MTTPHQSTAEAVLAATGPLGFDPPEDTEAAEPEAIEAEAPEVEPSIFRFELTARLMEDGGGGDM